MRACFCVLFLLLLLPAAVTEPRSAGNDPIVELTAGQIRGQLRGGIAVFQGNPYAVPPMGALRWREPQPVARWSGVRDATRPAAACFQDPSGLNPFIAPLAATYGIFFKAVQ
jgi:para-nitrobenzyl esterase